jgi:hypothetical protein
VQIGTTDPGPLDGEQNIIGAFEVRFRHILHRPASGAQKYDCLHDA